MVNTFITLNECVRTHFSIASVTGRDGIEHQHPQVRWQPLTTGLQRLPLDFYFTKIDDGDFSCALAKVVC